MKDRRHIQFPVTFDRVNRKKDRSLTLAFTTNLEINTDDFAIADSYLGHAGWLTFSEDPIEQIDVPDEPALGEGKKSKAQRMRAVYFLIWQKETDESEPFDFWFDRQFEKAMDRLKERLD